MGVLAAPPRGVVYALAAVGTRLALLQPTSCPLAMSSGVLPLQSWAYEGKEEWGKASKLYRREYNRYGDIVVTELGLRG